MKASYGRRSLLCVTTILVLAVLVGMASVATAGEFKPTKTIQFVVPYAPGGGSDVFARSIDSILKTEKLSPVQMLIVNQPGGSATIGTTTVAQSPGNTHMLLTFISGQVRGSAGGGKGSCHLSTTSP